MNHPDSSQHTLPQALPGSIHSFIYRLALVFYLKLERVACCYLRLINLLFLKKYLNIRQFVSINCIDLCFRRSGHNKFKLFCGNSKTYERPSLKVMIMKKKNLFKNNKKRKTVKKTFRKI